MIYVQDPFDDDVDSDQFLGEDAEEVEAVLSSVDGEEGEETESQTKEDTQDNTLSGFGLKDDEEERPIEN